MRAFHCFLARFARFEDSASDDRLGIVILFALLFAMLCVGGW